MKNLNAAPALAFRKTTVVKFAQRPRGNGKAPVTSDTTILTVTW